MRSSKKIIRFFLLIVTFSFRVLDKDHSRSLRKVLKYFQDSNLFLAPTFSDQDTENLKTDEVIKNSKRF